MAQQIIQAVTLLVAVYFGHYLTLRRESKIRRGEERRGVIARLRGLRFNLVNSWILNTNCKAQQHTWNRLQQIDHQSRQAQIMQIWQQMAESMRLVNEARMQLYEQVELLVRLFPKVRDLREKAEQTLANIQDFERGGTTEIGLHQANSVADVDAWAERLEHKIRDEAETKVGKPIDGLLALVRKYL